MKIFARQGDLVIEKLDNKPIVGDLTEATNVVFAGDSSGHRHRLMGTVQMIRTGTVTRVRLDKYMELVHEKSNGHASVVLSAGDYEIRRLRERGDGSDRAVED